MKLPNGNFENVASSFKRVPLTNAGVYERRSSLFPILSDKLALIKFRRIAEQG